MTFHETGRVEAPSYDLESLAPGEPLEGPGHRRIELTTIVVHPGARAERRADGAFVVNV